MSQVCQCFDLKRDAFYKYYKREKKRIVMQEKVVKMVKQVRKDLPRIGTRKLYKELSPDFKDNGIHIGRDKLFSILRENQMLIRRKKASCKTTDAYHRFYKYDNLIKGMKITAPNQVWVSDITYIRTVKGFYSTQHAKKNKKYY